MAHTLAIKEDLEEARAWFRKAGGAESPPDKAQARTNRLLRYHHRRRSAVHLLLGDSVARDSQLLPRFRSDLMINRAHAGATWASTLRRLREDLQPWEHATSTFSLEKGSIILWLSGNDVHDRLTGAGLIDDEVLRRMSQYIHSVISYLKGKGPQCIIVLGPLPRPGGHEEGIAWERTASYHMERTTKKEVDEMDGVSMTTLGRGLTKKLCGRHSMRRECNIWFRDGVHPNRQGYKKLEELLPVWLRFGGGD